MENIYILVFVCSFILFLLSIKWESYPIAIFSAILFLIQTANSLAIETFISPVFNNTSGNIEYGTHISSYYGLSAICLGFMFCSLILAFYYWGKNQQTSKW